MNLIRKHVQKNGFYVKDLTNRYGCNHVSLKSHCTNLFDAFLESIIESRKLLNQHGRNLRVKIISVARPNST